MLRLTPTTQHYAWGSPTAIPALFGQQPVGRPVAEVWFGAHASSPSLADVGDQQVPLDRLVASDPTGTLGEDVRARFGSTLPYLLKVIAAERPLSLQVHPTLDRARAGFAAEDAAHIPRTSARRNYRDRNHKPELLYAVTRFEALCGFRAPRRAADVFTDLDAPLARTLSAVLRAKPSVEGVREAFMMLLDPASKPDAEAVGAVADACRTRLGEGSPSPRADRTVVELAAAFPGDPGVVTSLLLNPVTLQPGDALFVPSGGVHAYLTGVGVEIMANSDNVLRAGLTAKHIDIQELLSNVDYVAAPPIRIAPETFHGASRVFYAPVDDFELSVTVVESPGPHRLPGRGPRLLLCLDGEATVHAASGDALLLRQGDAAFVPASDGALSASGDGTIVQADVP